MGIFTVSVNRVCCSAFNGRPWTTGNKVGSIALLTAVCAELATDREQDRERVLVGQLAGDWPNTKAAVYISLLNDSHYLSSLSLALHSHLVCSATPFARLLVVRS